VRSSSQPAAWTYSGLAPTFSGCIDHHRNPRPAFNSSLSASRIIDFVIQDPPETYILWHCAVLGSSEYASLSPRDNGYHLQGLTVMPLEDRPCHIEYAVAVDAAWSPHFVTATITTPTQITTRQLERDADGHWRLDGQVAVYLDGCTDVDLGWTPATNTIPIRRLDLAVGDTEAISAAWIRFPELDVAVSQQRYTRLADDCWRYQSGQYDFDLTTDVASGLVLEYGDDLWRAVARSTRSDATAR
jgi:hypothetical protein